MTPPVAPSAPDPAAPERLMITINGMELNVQLIREKSDDGRPVMRLVFDSADIRSIYADSPFAVISLDSADPIVKIDLPADAVLDVLSVQPEAAVKIETSGASYRLPLILWEDAARDAVMTISIGIAPREAIRDTRIALALEGNWMLADPVDFTIHIDGQAMERFGGIYVERSMTIDASVEPDSATVVWIGADGKLRYIPSVFQTEQGVTEAVFYAPHNSRYTVIQSSRTFTDVQNHWAERDIELLAGKLVLNGVSEDKFNPEGRVTRAEYAAMLARSLGLAEIQGATAFSDVHSDAWYAGAVNAVHEAGLIRGHTDGTFRPSAVITREEMAVMTVRAIDYAGSLPRLEPAGWEHLTDLDQAADWAGYSILLVLEAGIIEGVSDTSVAPQGYVTRAQSAVMISRLLRHLEFID